MGSTLNRKNLLLKEQILYLRIEPNERGCKNKNGRVASLKVYLKYTIFFCVQMIHPGMLVYGYVKDVGTYDLKMALPNGLIGTVAITNISGAYTEMIQQFAAKTQEEQEEVGEVISRAPDKRGYLGFFKDNIFYFSTKTYVVTSR